MRPARRGGPESQPSEPARSAGGSPGETREVARPLGLAAGPEEANSSTASEAAGKGDILRALTPPGNGSEHR
jgi:hypothetical protein